MKYSLNRNQIFLFLLAIYLAWVTATYLLEGRIHQMLHYNPAERIAYVIVANVLIGTILVAVALHLSILSKITTLERLGFRNTRRTFLAITIAFFVGLAIFLSQNPPSTDYIFILNLFAQVLPVSIAEVLVCWVLIGVGFESYFQLKSRVIALLIGIVAAEAFFALYHFAHSPPFNQIPVILFLLIPGLVTSLVFFAGRDAYAAILVQTFLGMVGVARAVNIELFSQPLYMLYFLAMVSLLILIIADLIIIRGRLLGPGR